MDGDDQPVVLVVQHEDDAPPAMLGDWLAEAGCRLEVSRPYAGEALPADTAAYDALLVLGGAMDSWDDEGSPWLPATRRLVRDAADRGTPALGICLGHQIAVAALGGSAGRNPAGATIAVVPVAWGDAAREDRLLAGVAGADRAVHWNIDVATDLPAGASVLARTHDGAPQAVRLAPGVWGVQCHPEADAAIVRGWAHAEPEGLEALGIVADDLVADVEAAREGLVAGWRPLGEALAGLARERRAVRLGEVG